MKAGDNITTDDITPASAEFSSMRSNMPLMAQYAYCRYDPEFSKRAQSYGKSIIIGGENYGQGSSREHAAITPMFLGVKAVIAKSMARIHKNNLINHGIVPMVFADPADYDKLELSDELSIPTSGSRSKQSASLWWTNQTSPLPPGWGFPGGGGFFFGGPGGGLLGSRNKYFSSSPPFVVFGVCGLWGVSLFGLVFGAFLLKPILGLHCFACMSFGLFAENRDVPADKRVPITKRDRRTASELHPIC